MIATSAFVVVLSALGLVSAQSKSNSTFKVDPSGLDDGTKVDWCTGQTNACIALCYEVTAQDCDSETLDFYCTCNNGESPDFNLYRDTMPFYVCKQAFQECITTNANDAKAQSNCTTSIDEKCGTIAPANATTKIGAPEATTSSSTSAPSSTGATQTTTTSSSLGAAMPTNFNQLGNGAAVVAAGLFAYML